ncbi:MAG: YceI family protein [Flammeovirgaceae bacterium]|nr:YceI family protein [Flammeovirgaceae bacterium]
MKRLFLFFCLVISTCLHAQKFVTEKAYVSFFSDALVEDIEAINRKANSIFDINKSEIAFLINNKDFEFRKSLMQTHFNEKYLESEQFPKSVFKGKVLGFDATKTGLQQVKATGKLSIHGVTKDVEIPGTIEISGTRITLKTEFMVVLKDYNVTIPQILWNNIAEQVKVTVDFVYRPFN